LRTTADGIWALGKLAGTPMFTYASFDDYRISKSGLIGGGRTTEGRTIPYCVFIDPELTGVQGVLPGPIKTEFFTSQGMTDAVFPETSYITAEALVDAALNGLDRNELVPVPTLGSKRGLKAALRDAWWTG
jgi:hypothetical protein